MTSIILLAVLAFGFIKLAKVVKNNPSASMETARFFQNLFRR